MHQVDPHVNKNMCDDLFEDANDEKHITEKSWMKRIDGVNKAGYRAGVDAGQEECLQEGFNSTFTVSSELLYTVSELRGCVSGKLSYNLMKTGSLSSQQVHLLETLLADIVQYETDLLKFPKELYTELQQNKVASCITTDLAEKRSSTSDTRDDKTNLIKKCDMASGDNTNELQGSHMAGECDNMESLSDEQTGGEDSVVCSFQGGHEEYSVNSNSAADKVRGYRTRLKSILIG